jgi:hypothetical protein
MEDGFRAAVANALGDVQTQHPCQPVEKLVLGSLVAALHHKRSRIGFDKEDPCPSMLRNLEGDDMN